MKRLKVGDRVVCVDADISYGALKVGEVYEVVCAIGAFVAVQDLAGKPALYGAGLASPELPWSGSRFQVVNSPPKHSDLDALKDMFTRAGTRFHFWHIKEYVDRQGNVVPCDAYTLNIGSENDGPYTEFLFDMAGTILPDGAKAVYDSFDPPAHSVA